MRGRVLIIAGSDSGGGAGIQADIKTVTMLDGYAATAITALTAQNTEGVFGVLPIPPEFIRRQIEVVLDDIGADAIKTGMLHDAAVIETVAAVLQQRAAEIPLVVDPVMVAKGGARLIDPNAVEALKRLLIARATVLTPNLPEAETLCGMTIGRRRGDAFGRRRSARARLPGGAGQGRAPSGQYRVGCACDRGGRQGVGKPAHRHPPHPRHRLHPRLGDRRRPRPRPRYRALRSSAPAPTSNARSRAPPDWAAATAPSTTPTRCIRLVTIASTARRFPGIRLTSGRPDEGRRWPIPAEHHHRGLD